MKRERRSYEIRDVAPVHFKVTRDVVPVKKRPSVVVAPVKKSFGDHGACSRNPLIDTVLLDRRSTQTRAHARARVGMVVTFPIPPIPLVSKNPYSLVPSKTRVGNTDEREEGKSNLPSLLKFRLIQRDLFGTMKGSLHGLCHPFRIQALRLRKTGIRHERFPPSQILKKTRRNKRACRPSLQFRGMHR